MSSGSKTKPELYFHVGMGKVASTYLRQAFFPKLQGAYFVPRYRKKQTEWFLNRGTHDKIILCRALDTNLEEVVREVAAHKPDAYPIIVFREPASWAASQYRRFVKNGFPGAFTDFIDIQEDGGHFKREELLFSQKLDILRKYFTQEPLVLLYEDMKADPRTFFDKISSYTGCPYDFDSVPLSTIHSSHGVGGLVLRRQWRARFASSMPRFTRIPVLHWIQRRIMMLWAYFLIRLERHLPDRWRPQEPLIDPDDLAAVRAFAAEDWQQVVAAARASDGRVAVPA